MPDRLPPEEWRTLMLETNEARLFRNINQDEYESGVETLHLLEEAKLWFAGVLQ